MTTLIRALRIFLLLTILTGILYPLIVTGIAQVLFPQKANGSLLVKGNEIIGSTLIGQQFDTAIYFMSRPSAVSYSTLPSGASNFGLTSDKLQKLVKNRRLHFTTFNNLDSMSVVPSEMLFASASGIDPHISPQAAYMQVERIAKYRNFSLSQKDRLKQLIKNQTEQPQFLLLGEDRINVLLLNLELDKIK
jgi:K+-transporting ATPase ATPase C chain